MNKTVLDAITSKLPQFQAPTIPSSHSSRLPQFRTPIIPGSHPCDFFLYILVSQLPLCLVCGWPPSDSGALTPQGHGVLQLIIRIRGGENTLTTWLLWPHPLIIPMRFSPTANRALGTRGLAPGPGLGVLESHSEPMSGSETFLKPLYHL